MNKNVKKRSGKEDHRSDHRLVNYKDLERNVLNEISKEFHDPKENKKKENK